MRFFARPLAATFAALLVLSGTAVAHELFDHEVPPLTPQSTPNNVAFASGPETAQWEFVDTITTGNPHSDLDFFTRGGETFLSAGTLGVAPNSGGQTIIQLTEGGEVAPKFVGSAPTASCVSNEAAALGLQHDVEASPKGRTILNTFNPYAPQGDAQIIVDATDANGRCHDQARFGGDGLIGLVRDKQGGLEILDVTDPTKPVEIGLTSHIGEAHTVNIDPKRPHIAYAVTSDSTGVTDGKRDNETSGFELDGWELVDMSSCMNFPAGTSVEDKRAACRPQVYRYRYPTLEMTQGHTNQDFVYGCHELEIYPNDRLTCGSGQAAMVFDMLGAFDDRGTPDDFTDDKPRGTPLRCTVRNSVSPGPFMTGAKITDCIDGEGGTENNELIVSKWLKNGAPSLEGVKFLGAAFHMGREIFLEEQLAPDFPSTEDIDFDHEAELSQSGNLLITTDERGGGVSPPGATCTQVADNDIGNGGVHFYRIDRLKQSKPGSPDEAFESYARTPEGNKAIYRAPIRTGGQASICTAHVFQQIPGQNRIFMAWYSQGTQVLDFTENPDGSVTFEEVGYFIPADANEWVSSIFKAQENPDGTFTYWGAAADFALGERGRNAIDVYKVTLPPAPKPADGPGVLPQRIRNQPVKDPLTGQTVIAGTQSGAPSCVVSRSFRSASVRGGRRLGLSFTADAPATIDLFRQTKGRRVTGEKLVKRYRNITSSVRWNGRDSRGRRLSDGYYLARFAARTKAGTPDERRFALQRRNGRFRVLRGYERKDQCGLLRRFKLFRPVFGGRTGRPLTIGFRLANEARASIVVRRGSRVVKRFAEQSYLGGRINRRRISAKLARKLRRGRYSVSIVVRDGSRTITSTLRATRV